jgi:Restriction endonuclease XhoI
MVTGGRQMDGFVSLFARIVQDEGIAASAINIRATTLPGYFRPEKDWDLVVVVGGRLIASVEFKSHVGSFGNNFNNRVEEALGNATDLNTAYREGAFRPSSKPWLGYMMLLEEHTKSTTPVKLRQPHFPAFAEFRDASYQRRYELFCTRLVRERLYDSACLVISPSDKGSNGEFKEPVEELTFGNFIASLQGKLTEARRRSSQ